VLHNFLSKLQDKDKQISRLQGLLNDQSQPTGQPSHSIPSSHQTQSRLRHDARKTCESRLKILTPGSDINLYTREAARILATEGADLSEDDQIDILRNKLEHDKDISLRIADRLAGNPPRRLSEYLGTVNELFAPQY
jgi:hypothetical protein